MKHNFHFVLNQELKDNISNFAKSEEMSLSEAVVYIFNFMKPVIEKHYFKDVVCKKPGYSCFGADCDLHVYFEKTDYRYLRQIQSNLYCFSIALVLRWVLNEFFDGVCKFGFALFCKIVDRLGKIHLRIERKINKNGEMQHMFYSIQKFEYICHIFDKEYNLLQTKFT